MLFTNATSFKVNYKDWAVPFYFNYSGGLSIMASDMSYEKLLYFISRLFSRMKDC